MIKKLFYIASLLNVAQLIFCSYLAVKECDYVLISCIAIIAGIFVQVGLYIHYKYLQNRDVTIQTPPNGETPGTLGRIFGIGVLLIGKWRKYAETYVGYTFFFFILPLFPIGCYRYKVLKSGVNSIAYNIYGSEEWSGKELFCIYTYFYGGIIWFMSLLVQIILSI